MAWLDASELRIGLGCMRMSTDDSRDEQLALATIAAAAGAGITVFDTARSYGRDETELGHNERLLARGLRRCRADGSARVLTKGGMARRGGAWVPDGRAKTIRGDCEASLEALDGLSIDLYFIHAPDPRTPWRTSVRALARLVDEGLVRHVGVANVNRRQLDEALDLAPLAAVQVALSPFDDRALRGGVLERCVETGLALIAHSPLGGPRRSGGVARREALAEAADARGATAAEVALAWLLDLSPAVVAIPGARRPETARSAARAATLALDEHDRALLAPAFGREQPRVTRAHAPADADVVLVMGIPGAGKTRIAEEYVRQGYVRLNRDERGGSLREVARALEEVLSSGARRVVLDNTYLTRVSRSYAIDSAARHEIGARCVWVDTPLAQAQVNAVERLLDRLCALPTPEELKALARREPGVVITPTSQMRALRELEEPSQDEGLAGVDRVAFERTPQEEGQPGVLVAANALRGLNWQGALEQADPAAPHLVFHWEPDASVRSLDDDAALLAREISGSVQTALCPHPAGPPTCWCRPPLPGLLLDFARQHGVDLARSTVIGSGAAHKTLATTLGARYVAS